MFVLKYRAVNPELAPYVNDYYNIVHKFCPDKQEKETNFYIISFVDSMSDYNIGVCYHQINGYQIEINRKFWLTASNLDRRQLLYHELAHCVINKPHVEDMHNYMYPDFYSVKYQSLYEQVALDVINWCKE